MLGMAALYQHLKTKSVLVRRFTKHPIGAHAEVGEPSFIAQEDLPTRLVPEVLRALDAYGHEVWNETVEATEKARQRDPKADAKFRREHSYVSISRDVNGVITILPTRRTRGGSMGYDEDIVSVLPSEDTQALYTALVAALAKAGTAKFHMSISRTRSG
jgi:hypothetical protein